VGYYQTREHDHDATGVNGTGGASSVRVLIINNIRSGQGDSRRYEFVSELCRRGANVTVRPIDETHSVESTLEDVSGFDAVATLGGDGTVSAAAYALRGTGMPLLAYPAGTANAVALNLGVLPDPIGCAQAVFDLETVRVDLGEIVYEHDHRPPEGRERRGEPRATAALTMGFVAIAGVGFDAEVMEHGAELKQQFGAAAYLMAALQNPSPRFAKIELELDGEHVSTEGTGVLLVNFGRLQFDITVTHDSNAQDGMLEVVVIKARHVVELLPAVIASYLDKIVTYPSRSHALDTYRARTVTLRCKPALRVQADGEVLPGATPLTCRVLPQAATFIVPSSRSAQAAISTPDVDAGPVTPG
jgi:diacylglycerol kinase family enzyme